MALTDGRWLVPGLLCRESAELDRDCRRFEAALRLLDERFRLYQYIVKRRHGAILRGAYDNPVVQEAVENRATYLREKAEELYCVEIYFVIAYEGWRPGKDVRQRLMSAFNNPIDALRQTFSVGAKLTMLEDDLNRGREILAGKVSSFIVQLEDVIRLERLGKNEAFRFLRRLLNYTPHKAAGPELKYDEFVDFQLCDSALECHRDHLRFDDEFVQVLTLKEPPARTFAHMLRELEEIPSQFIIVSEWKRATHSAARKLIHSKRRHFHNSKASMLNYLNQSQPGPRDLLIDDSAAALVAELGSCLEELEVRGNSFGHFSMTAVLYDEDRARLKRAVAECYKVFAAHGAHMTEERYNLLNALLAILPGNHLYNLRRMWLTSTNCADLAFLFATQAGELENRHLGAEYLAVFETSHGTPYFLNLHYEDVAHTLLLGATGSGKSFLLNFLLTHLQKYRPFTYVFDLGGSYESLTRRFEATYVPVGVETRSFTINPFSLPLKEENLHFLFAFIRVLIESSGYSMSSADEKDLFEQIENIYAVEPEQRRLFTLSNVLNRNLRAQLQKWVQGGPYGSLFDHARDNLTFAHFQTFDFEGMSKVPQVLEPLLFYVLHRASAAIQDPAMASTLKIFVIDEAWRFLRHATIKRYVVEALKTWRKKNAAMVLATQSSEDLLHSDMLSAVAESCPTKIFLANPGMDRRAYQEIFHLNQTEVERIAALIPKQQMLLKRPDRVKILHLNVDRKEYLLYSNSPQVKEKRAASGNGAARSLEILAKE